MASSSRIHYFEASGTKQMRFQSADDLRLLNSLDLKLWVCLSAPVDYHELDSETLKLMDSDSDGRFRCSELLESVNWILDSLANYDSLEKGVDQLQLSDINPECTDLIEAFKTALKATGKADSEVITLSDLICINNVNQVEKLLRFTRDILAVVNNFVSIPDFYKDQGYASFQAGTLYLNGSAYHLSLRVHDLEPHIELASKSGIFLIYSKLHRANEEPQMIVTAVTSHNHQEFEPGMHGVFFDRSGNAWDAQITEVVRNPISLEEAILAPFKGVFAFIKEQLEKITQSQKKMLRHSLVDTTKDDMKSGTTGVGGMLAGGGVALAALSSSFAYITTAFGEMTGTQVLFGLLCFLGLLVIPAGIVGYLKLRARDLSIVLHASGWAINRKMRLSPGLAKRFTSHGVFPKSSKRVKLP